MANKKITELNEATSVSNNDWLVIVDVANDETKKVHAGEVGGNIPIQDIAPQDPEENDLWIDTSSNNDLKYYNGSTWELVSGEITGDTLPIGAIVPFGGWNAPTGWLICDGTLLNKTDYPELFNAIGYSFGGEDGGSTFGLPDFSGRIPVGIDENDADFDGMGLTGGSKTHSLTRDELPSNFRYPLYNATAQWGIAEQTDAHYPFVNGTGTAFNIMQPYQTVNYIIKAKQSAGLVANVSNTQSESTTDTYSCDYINGTILYNSEGGTTATVTLSESVANFRYIEIFYEGADNYNSVKIYDPNGKRAYLVSGWFGSNTNGNIKIANISIFTNTISKVNTTSLNYDTTYANASEENGIAIHRVIGYK